MVTEKFSAAAKKVPNLRYWMVTETPGYFHISKKKLNKTT
jgi:hypothetical protein